MVLILKILRFLLFTPYSHMDNKLQLKKTERIADIPDFQETWADKSTINHVLLV